MPLSIDRPSLRRGAISAVLIGTFLEAYDFIIFGLNASYLAKAIFPTADSLVAILLVLATFGAGFLTRPLGALILGSYIDRAGWRAGLSLTFFVMAAGTLTIATTPTYATLGAAAPLLLVLGRLLQGFSAGGELSGSAALLVGCADPGRRGRITSLQPIAQGLAILAGSIITAIVTAWLSPAQMADWGWRVPFLIGLVILPAGFYLRTTMPLPTADAEARSSRPMLETVRDHRSAVVTGVGIMSMGTACLYILLVFMPVYATRELKIGGTTALLVNALGVAAYSLSAWFAGGWSDVLGRRRAVLATLIPLLIAIVPAFLLISHRPSVTTLMVAQVVLGALTGAYVGPLMTMVGELFPARVRSSGYSLAYNFATTVFGGFAPFTTTWLVAASGSKLAPALYIVLLGLFALVVLRLNGPAGKAYRATPSA